MKRFARLFTELDETTKTSEKVAALTRYFSSAPAADAAWAVHFLSGGRFKRLIGARKLAEWAMEASAIPSWLFEECYTAVGDLAETIALLLPPAAEASDRSLDEWISRLRDLAGATDEAQRTAMHTAWRELDGTERFVWNKLITGGFRVGVSQQLVVRALSQVSGVDQGTMAHRLTGTWKPTAQAYQALMASDTRDADHTRPYPFFLAHPLEESPESLGDVSEWQVEWKWDGIRAQLIRRRGDVWIWSRGEELVTERFPELAEAAALLPDGTVLDGEIVPWREGRALGFGQLQRRIGRKVLGTQILTEVPVVLIGYDVLELEGEDVRTRSQAWRRERLTQLIGPGALGANTRLVLSPLAAERSWDSVRDAYQRARDVGAEGLMLKRVDAPYGVGRRRGPWWKWKVSPHTVDAVMVYAQAGHGRRASLNTDYTFAVWNNGELVPFAKAYSGLTDEEIRRLDNWVRKNTIEKFGPVRSVTPEQVFEIAFEGIHRSTRHKSGVAVRFPRILRWRTDKSAKDADTLELLLGMLDNGNAPDNA